MNREEYQNVKEIFQDALDLAPDERAEYLDKNCSDNLQLRHEVEKLLDAFDDDYLEHPAVEKFADSIISKSNLSIGQEFGRYKILKKIGAGGMGEVFLAEDVRLKRKIALKILPVAISQNKNYLRRFEQEAYSVSALNHPNILTVHEFGDDNETNFIATEFVEGKTLRERLISNEHLSISETLDIVSQVAAALSAAHNAGIIHRDIKPENIMIRADGLVKVLDFGLAKLTEKRLGEERGARSEENDSLITPSPHHPIAPSPNLSTTKGLILGTAAYMSPEQAKGKKNDARSDIFSFGIVFYEMLTGRRAFEGETSLESISSILKDEPQPISEILPEIPPEMERIVNKTLRKEPKERYQTAKDLLIDLKNAKHDLDLHDSFGRVPNREVFKTQILPVTITNENQNQLTSSKFQNQSASAEYAVAPIKNYNFIYLAIVVLVTAGIGFGIYKYADKQGNQLKNTPFESVKITKVTDSGKVGHKIALSRDGKWLAYSIVEGTKASLWLKQVAVPDSNTQIVPPAETYYRELSFSPDGNYLYYSILEGTSNNLTVYQMPILGGGTTRKFLSGINGGINFSPDGKQITYGVEDLANDESILMIANADGSEARQVVKLKGNDEIASSRGRWSPDGKSIALWVGTNNPKTQELATVSVETGEITRLETRKFNDFHLWEWLPDGKSMIVLADEKPAQKAEFWKISFPTGETEKITNDLNGYDSMSISADASTLATVQSSSNSHIWTVPINDSAEAKQITFGSNVDYNPHWTPDGKLLFERMPGDIYYVNPNGGNPQRLTTNSANRFSTVSPDGRYIVYVSTQSGIPLLWRMDIDGGNPKQLTTEFSVEPNISPDSREIIYSVGVDSSRIWKIGIDGGQPVQLTDNESRNALFSPDGKYFACRWWADSKSQQKIAIIPATGGKPVKIFDLNAAEIRWMPDGRSFQYSVIKDGLSSVWSQPIAGGKPQQLTKFSNLTQSFELSPDGKQIAVTRGTQNSDVVLISGFWK